MDLKIYRLRKNLNTFTLQELKKEVIKMKHLNFGVTRIKPNQVIEVTINYRFLFPHLMTKIGTKQQAKPKTNNTTPTRPRGFPPVTIKLTPEILNNITAAYLENMPPQLLAQLAPK